jgi:hypothetical protein
MVIVLKLNSHPRITFVSKRQLSDNNLLFATIIV